MSSRKSLAIQVYRNIVQPVVVALLAWSAWLLSCRQLEHVFNQGFADAEKLELSTQASAILAILAVALFLSLPVSRLVSFFFRRPSWARVDTALAAGLVLGLAGFLVQSLLPWAKLLPGALEINTALSVILALRLPAVLRARSRSEPFGGPNAHLFDQVLAEQKLTPISSRDEDRLQRKGFLDQFYKIVAQSRSVSLNFGIEGSWGSGKTSLLNLLKEKLEDDGFEVLTFNLWSYREPERLIQVYFDQLANSLGKDMPQFQAEKLLRRLASGLMGASGNRVSFLSSSILGDFSQKNLQDIRDQISKALLSRSKPLVVILDDLDRLERDELVAVLRSARLMSDLPKLTQVLAYDRKQVARTLFPDDSTGARARDHLAKIIGVEYSIGGLPGDLAGTILEESLGKFLGELKERERKVFHDRLDEHGARLFASSLRTPREVRRIAMAVASRWEGMRGNVNPFDLFVLTIVQYRFPEVYRTIREHPEWFVELAWSDDPSVRIVDKKREALEKAGQAYIRELVTDGDFDYSIAGSLVNALFPNKSDVGAGPYGIRPHLVQEDARRLRSIFHPDLFERYFYLYIPDDFVSEAEMEEYADLLKGTQGGVVRQHLLLEIIGWELRRGRLSSFFEQWDLVFPGTPRSGQRDLPLIEDLALGWAAASHILSDQAAFFVASEMERAAGKAAFLVSSLQDIGMAEALIRRTIGRGKLSFCGAILLFCHYSDKSDKLQLLGDIDLEILKRVLVSRVEMLVEADISRIFSLDDADLNSVVEWLGRDERFQGMIGSALMDEPLPLVRILALGTPRTWRNGDTERLLESFSPPHLDEKISLKHIYDSTRSASLGSWVSHEDRSLVKKFRDWVECRDEEVASD